MSPLYTIPSVISSLFQYFSAYFVSATKPTRVLLTWMLIGMLALEDFPSVRSLHRRFLSRVCHKSLNSYYHACSAARLDDAIFLSTTARLAVSIIPETLQGEPVFLGLDDTTIAKFGKRFEDVSILHDHALHTGNPFVNGHCFVSLTLSVPVLLQQHGIPRIRHVSVPLGYRMWQKGQSKLDMAAGMVADVMPLLEGKQVVLCFDSWYAKRALIQPLQKYGNLAMVCNARHDTAMYELPPARTGKRGRPAKRGGRLSLADFMLSYRHGQFRCGHRQVMTNIFGDMPVHAYVTETPAGSRRLFFCTKDPAAIHISCAWQEKELLRDVGPQDMEYVPLRLYTMRWPIEVNYFEQKVFWGLGRYMVRSKKGIERVLNMINAAHGAMRLLPYRDSSFQSYQGKSPQELRAALSDQIRRQVFFADLGAHAQTMENSSAVCRLLEQLIAGIFRVA